MADQYDWADRRAEAFFYEHLEELFIRKSDGLDVISALAADYRALAAKCEPLSALDL